MSLNSFLFCIKGIVTTLCFVFLLITQLGCSTNIETIKAAATTTDSKQANTASIEINLAKGQIFSYIVVISEQGEVADVARKEYYGKALPLAGEYGFKREGVTFEVSDSIVGEHEPEYIVTGSWPNLQSFQTFENHPEWPALRNLRPKIWKEVRFHRSILKQPLNLRIHPDKFYTLAVAWFNPNHPGDYKKYLDGLEQELNKVGGRFLYKMYEPMTESMDKGFVGPNQITLVEWDTETGLNELTSSDMYKQFAPLAQSGLNKFEFHRIKPIVQ